MSKIKKLLVSGLAVTILAASTLSVSATGLEDIFDARYYADNNEDLKEAFGYDEELLYQHFLQYGLKEGRNMSPILDVAAYREAYADLDAAFGDDWDAYVEHFFTYGVYEEGRREGVLFDPVAYAEAYGDISEAFGGDVLAITEHYMTTGIEEKRTEGTAQGYSDIATAKVEEAKKEADEAKPSAPNTDKPSRPSGDNKPSGNKPSVQYSPSGRTEYEYDANGNKTKETLYTRDGEMTQYLTYQYNANGDVICLENHFSDGYESRGVYEYDGNGNLIKLISYNNNSGTMALYEYRVYTLDANGYTKKVSIYDANDVLEGYQLCECDSRGNITKYTYYNADGNYVGYSLYEYDGNDSITLFVEYDAEGKETYRNEYEYHANGQAKSWTTVTPWGMYLDEFDENGNQISMISYSNGVITDERHYEYHANGVIAKEVSEYDGNKFVNTYYSNGQLESENNNYAEGNSYASKYDIDGNVLLIEYHEADGSYTIVKNIVFNGESKETSHGIYNAVNDTLYEEHYEYDANGIIQKETLKTYRDKEDGTKEDWYNVIEYKNGIRSKRTGYRGVDRQLEIEEYFDENGNLIESNYYN